MRSRRCRREPFFGKAACASPLGPTTLGDERGARSTRPSLPSGAPAPRPRPSCRSGQTMAKGCVWLVFLDAGGALANKAAQTRRVASSAIVRRASGLSAGQAGPVVFDGASLFRPRATMSPLVRASHPHARRQIGPIPRRRRQLNVNPSAARPRQVHTKKSSLAATCCRSAHPTLAVKHLP